MEIIFKFSLFIEYFYNIDVNCGNICKMFFYWMLVNLKSYLNLCKGYCL